MEGHIRKKEKEKIINRMGLKEKAEQTKREIAVLNASRENAERELAAPTDKHKT